jgi:hypothetical protein
MGQEFLESGVIEIELQMPTFIFRMELPGNEIFQKLRRG